jgi:hypothetical protein
MSFEGSIVHVGTYCAMDVKGQVRARQSCRLLRYNHLENPPPCWLDLLRCVCCFCRVQFPSLLLERTYRADGFWNDSRFFPQLFQMQRGSFDSRTVLGGAQKRYLLIVWCLPRPFRMWALLRLRGIPWKIV